MKVPAGSEMIWTTYRTSEKYQINSPFFSYPISPPFLNITGSLVNFESTRQLEILETVLSVVSCSAVCLFSWWKHSGWRNKGIAFEKKGKEEQLILITTFHHHLHKSVFGDLQTVLFSHMKIFSHYYVFRKPV